MEGVPDTLSLGLATRRSYPARYRKNTGRLRSTL